MVGLCVFSFLCLCVRHLGETVIRFPFHSEYNCLVRNYVSYLPFHQDVAVLQNRMDTSENDDLT